LKNVSSTLTVIARVWHAKSQQVEESAGFARTKHSVGKKESIIGNVYICPCLSNEAQFPTTAPFTFSHLGSIG